MAEPTLAALVGLLDRELRLLVSRLRGWSPSAYGARAGVHGTRAVVLRHLAQRLAEAGQGVEEAAAGPPSWRTVPVLGDHVLADQVAVTGRDLLAAAAATGAPATVWTRAGRSPLVPVVAGALAEVVLHRHDVDGAAPGPQVAAAVLAVLAPGTPGTPEALLSVARVRCSSDG